MKKTILKVAKITGITVMVLIVAGAVGISWFTGTQIANNLVLSNEGKDTKQASIYQLGVWDYDYKTFEDTYSVEKNTVVAEDDAVVHFARLGRKQVDGNQTVILVHGFGGDFVCVYPQAEMYLENGWDVIAMDQRASGDSEEPWVTFGYYEKLDVAALVDYARDEMDQETVIVHGFSMGGATTGLYGGTKHASENVDAIVMDSSFESMESMFIPVFEEMETGMPTDYAVACGDFVLKLRFGFGFDDADVRLGLETCEVPVLIIHSEQDSIVPDEMSEHLINTIQHQNKELWTINTKHIEGYIDYPVEYEEKVMMFLEEQIR